MDILTVILGNVAIVLAVLWQGGSGVNLIGLYWIENLLIGLLTIPRMLRAPGESFGQRIAMSVIFVLHYGGFCAGHGLFLYAFFGEQIQELIGWNQAFVLLIAIHVIGFFRDEFFSTQEPLSLKKEMASPYFRIIPVHLMIILTGGLIQSGAMEGIARWIPVSVLFAIKTAVEVRLMKKQRL